MFVLDIDKFKNVNDTFGHLAGDEVLKNIAQIMTSSMRWTDVVARYGGEEFIVLMPETSISGAVISAEKIRSKIKNSQFINHIKVTVSVGVAERIWDESLDDWFKRADKALYQAKNRGRDKVC